MKKFFCLLLTLLFILSFPISSFAETIENSSGSASFDVMASYSSTAKIDIYSVDITWGNMNFEYHEEEKKWNPSTHKYETQKGAYWSCIENSNAITVTNHSSKPITAALSYTPVSSYNNIAATFYPTTMSLAAPTEGSDPGTAPSGTAKVTLNGTLPSSATSNVKLGSITVTISPSSVTNSSGSASGGTVSGGTSTSEPVGYLNLYSKLESDTTDIKYNIYQQSANIYVAEFTVDEEEAIDDSVLPDTTIHINGTNYYIYEAANVDGKYFYFTPNSTVKISTTIFIDVVSVDKSYNKTTSVEAGKKYRLTVDLSDSDNMTATLEEIS